MSLNLFIIGPSGCGKSTQAKLIAEKYSLTHMSMGQLLRNEIASNSDLGKAAQDSINRGVWTPNEIVYPILINALKNINNQNFIIDGFPRLVEQGIFIDAHLNSVGQKTSLLIHLDVTFEEILARRQKKGDAFQDKDRTDNTPEAVAARQKSYEDTISPIFDFYQNQGKLFRVDGNRPVEPIFEDICQEIEKINKPTL
jgi:adenylate kinase